MPSCAMLEIACQIESIQKKFLQSTAAPLPPWEWTLLNLFILGGFRFKNSHWIQFNFKSQTGFHPQSLDSKPKLTNQQVAEILRSSIKPEEFQYFQFYFQKTKTSDVFWNSALQGRWKQIPSSSLQSLKAWSENLYPLVLCSQVLTPQQMSELQSQGQRAVTVFETATDLKQIHEHHRDAYLFTVHDLEHANHFFSLRKTYQQQTKLAQLIQKSFLNPGFHRSWIHDDLIEDYHYLISDMNTHPWHLYLTLQTLLLKSHKLQTQNNLSQPLTPLEEKNFQNKIKNLMQDWKINYPPMAEDFQSSLL